MGISFTKEQQEAIFDDGHNLLVSASAGSGKTTVMIERIIQLLLKYKNSDSPLSISNFLVVTFTKASASDMKQKLINRLLKLEQDEFVLSQIEKVSTSDISNLHSFCSRLISTYFYEVGVDPAVHIIDDVEASFLKNKALDRLFEQKEKDASEDFFELFDIFQKKRSDVSFREIIKRFDDNLKENIDGEKWFFDSINKCYGINLEKNVAAQKINQSVSGIVRGYKEDIEKLLAESNKLNIEKLSNYLVDLSSQISTVNFHNSYIVNARNVFDIKIKAAPKLGMDFLDIEERTKTLSSKIKKGFEDFRANFVSNDEKILQSGLESSKATLLKLYALVKEFDTIYEKMKRDTNSLDFHDLEHLALKILDNAEIRENVRKKYRYVLVDEYQDINSVQEKIISLVSSESNRFMVGDVKQSIYRFRFCDPDIFLDKFLKYSQGEKESKLIKLNCNFRSDKKILKFVDKTFSGVMTDDFGEYEYKSNALFVAGESNLDNEKAANLCFISARKKQEEIKAPSGIYSVKNHKQPLFESEHKALAEASLVARKIKEIMRLRNDVTYEDFAVLVSSRNENIDEFIEAIKSFGLPVASDKKYDLMKMTHIQEIVNFIKLSINQNNDIILFKVLKSRLFDFDDNELSKIRLTNKSDKFYEVFYAYDKENKDSLSKKVTLLKTKLNKFSQLAKLMQIKEFVNMIIEEFGLKLINQAGENGTQKVKDIENFISKLPNVDVYDYVNLYADYSLIKENECSGNAIKIMTIHKAKGIEFKFVFLINLSNEFNFKSTYQNVLFNKTLGVGIDCFDIDKRIQSSTIPISAIRMVEKRKLVEEQQRVLYVAMTRAVEKLFVICTEDEKNLDDEFSKRPTAFIEWFAPVIKSELNGHKLDYLNFEKYDIEELLDAPQKESKELRFEDINYSDNAKWFKYPFEKIKNIPLKNSISKILTGLSDDESYESQQIIEGLKSSADRGTLYHKILQKIDLRNLKLIDTQIEKIVSNLSDEEKSLVDIPNIKNIFALDFFKDISKDDIIFQEREFYAKMPTSLIDDNFEGDEFIMQGIIDLLIIRQNEIWILDYKTGRISDEKIKKYNIQISAYANVVERAFNKKVTRKLLCFVDEQKNIEI